MCLFLLITVYNQNYIAGGEERLSVRLKVFKHVLRGNLKYRPYQVAGN